MMDAPAPIRELARLPEQATAAACFGAPATAGDRTIIPVAEVIYGFGMGWGGGTAANNETGSGGGGGGGGSRLRGIAVIEVAADGVQVHPVVDTTALRLASIAFASAATAIVARTLLKLIRG